MGFLINNGKQSQTVRSYVSAIRAILAEDGIELNQNEFLLSSLTRACKINNNRVKTRLPIHKNLLKQIILKTNDYFMAKAQPYLRTLYIVLFSTAYYGLLQVGELTQGSHPVKVTDIQVASNKKKLRLILHSSKTHSKGMHPQIIKIMSTQIGSDKNPHQEALFCPYHNIHRFSRLRPGYESIEEPFFVFRDNSPVTPARLRETLKTILDLLGKE